MESEVLVRLFAEENRTRAFAAIALGARSQAEVAAAARLSAKETAMALRRLQEHGVVTLDGDGLSVNYREFREQSKKSAAAAKEARTSADGTDSLIHTFLPDGRLVRLPARWERKKVVLEHIGRNFFEPDVNYEERTVNDILGRLCEGGAIDHVTIRRYLVDLHMLHRRNGLYWRPAQAAE